MGFDNECILNIQSLPGEYFCPVCRTLVYPSEALQAQCTHLYCKPCLAYVVATTRACPYDGYLVTEADSKPLLESNKSVVEAINGIQVHCLFHRSGCQWQGTFSECITHCTDCSFGNSPVVCNRCGTQIIHRQVQEHAQICPGVQPQVQQAEGTQAQASVEQNQAVAQVAPASQDSSSQNVAVTAAAPASTQAASSVPATAPSTTAGHVQSQVNAAVQPQTVPQTATTADQWYQQQQEYQQYYQQYPGYDPNQQHYQQFGQYEQQVQAQYPQPQVQPHPQQVIPGQQNPQQYLPPQPQALPQSQPQVLPQTQPQLHAPFPQMQAPLSAQQPHPQMQLQGQPPPHGQVPAQPMGHPQPQTFHPSQPPQLQPVPRPQHQQPVTPQPYPSAQLPPTQPHPQAHPQPQLQQQPHLLPQQHVQLQPLPHPQHQPMHPHSQPQSQHPSAHAVTGHQSYPQPQPHQQMLPGAQRPVHIQPQHPAQMQNQFPPQQPPQMRPPQPHAPLQVLHGAGPPPNLGPHPNQPPVQQQFQHPLGQPLAPQGLPPHQVHGQVPPQQSLRPQGPHFPGYPQMQTGVARPIMANHGMTQHSFPFGHSASAPTNLQNSSSSPVPNQNYRANGPPQISSGQQLGPGIPRSEVEVAVENSKVQQTGSNVLVPNEKSESSDLMLQKHESHFKSEAGEEKVVGKAEENPPELLIDSKANELAVKEEATDKLVEQFPSGEMPETAGGKEDQQDKKVQQGANQGQEGQDEKFVHAETEEERVHSVSSISVEQKSLQPGEGQSKAFGSSVHPMPNSTLERHPHQHMPYGPSQSMQPTAPQRPLAPGSDRMLPSNIPLPGPNLERRTNDPLPHQMQLHGQPLAPNPMRPPMQGFPENMPHHGPPPQVGFPGPGMPLPLGRGPGFSSGMPSQLHPQGQMPPFHAGAKMPQGEPLPGPPISGPRPGSFDSSASMMARGPPGLETFSNKGPGFYNSRHHEPHQPMHVEHGPADQQSAPNMLKYSGPPGNIPERSFHSAVEGRFRAPGERFIDEGFKHPHDERFRPFPVDPTRGIVDRREFEEDLKQFPRAVNLDGEGVPKFENHLSMSRAHERGSLDRLTFGFDQDGMPSRKAPPYPTDGSLPGSSGSSYFHSLDIGERQRFRGLPDDNFGRKNDSGHPDFRKPTSDFGHHRMDGRSNKSPGRDYSGLPLNRFTLGSHSHIEDYNEREPHGFSERSRMFNHPSDIESRHSVLSPPTGMPSHFRRNEFGPGNPRIGDQIGPGMPDFMPGHLRGGELLGNRMGPGGLGGFDSHLRMGDPVGFGGTLLGHRRFGEPGFSSTLPHGFYNAGSLHGDSFDYLQKRKLGTVGWCRICKIDCETGEGLDLHSQTREHQKMAMDIVLSIKQDNAKRQKLSGSEENVSLDDAKMKKGSAETRKNKN